MAFATDALAFRGDDAVVPIEKLRQLHLEVTSHCNAACPQCARNCGGDVPNPFLPRSELTLQDVQQILPTDIARQLDLIFLCGNYGDPLVGRDTLAICEYLRSSNPQIKLQVHTNGSGRDRNWWQRLASAADTCRFGIDGLEDTNHLHRRHTRWELIMQSARAYIDAGGQAEWQFIVFKHNEHQIEQARALSRQLGFTRFIVRAASRFRDGYQLLAETEIVDREGRRIGSLEPPSDGALRNSVLVDAAQIFPDQQTYDAYLEGTPIACKALATHSIYISSEALVFPCCWLGHIYSLKAPCAGGLNPILAALPHWRQTLDARRRPLGEILREGIFQRTIPAHWEPGRARLRTCAAMCGSRDWQSAQTVSTFVLEPHLLPQNARRP